MRAILKQASHWLTVVVECHLVERPLDGQGIDVRAVVMPILIREPDM
jgi:hypothetical protein